MITGAKVKTDRRDAFALAKLKRFRIRHLFFTMPYSAAFARVRKMGRKGENEGHRKAVSLGGDSISATAISDDTVFSLCYSIPGAVFGVSG
jgi:hypothetical protein